MEQTLHIVVRQCRACGRCECSLETLGGTQVGGLSVNTALGTPLEECTIRHDWGRAAAGRLVWDGEHAHFRPVSAMEGAA